MRSEISEYEAVEKAAEKFVKSVAEGNSKYARELFVDEAVLFGYLDGTLEHGSIEQFYDNVDSVAAGDEFKGRIDVLLLEKDDSHAIVIMFADSIDNSDDSISSLESKGYKFIGEETYDAEGFKITQQNYEKGQLTVYSYNFKVSDGEYCIITFTMPSSENALEGEDNPVTGILQTLE